MTIYIFKGKVHSLIKIESFTHPRALKARYSFLFLRTFLLHRKAAFLNN